MKKFIPIVMTLSLIAGCSSAKPFDSEKVKAKETETNKDVGGSVKPKNKAKSLTDVYVPNPQVPNDTNLLQVGKSVKDDKGEMNLLGLAALNKVYSVGPIEMKIKNVKLLQLLPTYSLMDYFHYYTENYEDIKYVKVEVELINKSAKTVQFGPVAHLETSNGEKKDFKDDFYIEYLGGEIEANGSKQGSLGFIIEKSSPKPSWIEITTSDVLDKNNKKVAGAQKIKIDFEY
ncbi:hypothetical protein ACQYAD_11515 [Neobacillus sp. SM06]|uniref:hypothetical protein n=1 Tax=Neobacillus sp. SM06 TaxID=3422492 RepID=UPI003D2CBB0E